MTDFKSSVDVADRLTPLYIKPQDSMNVWLTLACAILALASPELLDTFLIHIVDQIN